MKKLENPAVLVLIAAVALTVFMIIRSQNSYKNLKTSDPEKFVPYISAHSSYVISKNDPILIQLTPEFFNKLKSQKIKNNLISIFPEVKGQINIKDNNIIEFKPDKPLESGKKYFITFNLRKIDKRIPGDLKHFTFAVHTRHQNISLSLDKVTTTDRQEFTKQDVTYKIKLNDKEDLTQIKEAITTKIDDKSIEVEIEQLKDNEFQLNIKNIQRKNTARELKIEFNGENFGVGGKGMLKLEIPPIDEFKLLEYKVNTYPEQYINLIFSDPIKEDQLLEGLITLSENQDLKYLIIDNIIKIIPDNRIDNTVTLYINENIKNIHGKKLEKPYSYQINFKYLKPALAKNDNGVILPSSHNGQYISFLAVNIRAVDVRITKIFQNNILQFLQDNDLSGSYNLNNVAKVIKCKTVSLEQTDVKDFSEWNLFHLNLSDIIEPDPGAIYRVEIAFRKENCIYPCSENQNSGVSSENKIVILSENDDWSWFNEYYYPENIDEFSADELEINYGYDNYYDENNWDYYWNYNLYDDPCSPYYYGYSNAIKYNVLATDIGLIAKMGKDNKIHCFVTNILNSEFLRGAKIEIFNYQQQLIASGTTNSEGYSVLNIPKNEKPYFVVATSGKQKNYIKLENYNALSTSEFNVYGEYNPEKIKAFIYSERGVRRPGDTIYLGLIINDKQDPIPTGHPIVLEVRNPKNQLIYKEVQNKNDKSFHVFKFTTKPNDPTGYYNATIKIGSNIFTKSIMVETIRPNRLNIEINLDKNYLSGDGTVNAIITAKWLHGAEAADLETKTNISLNTNYNPFPQYKDYNFINNHSNFDYTTKPLLSGKTDKNGVFKAPVKLSLSQNAPGVLNAKLDVKVFEKSGNFSMNEKSFVYYPFNTFVGIKIKENDKYPHSLPINKDLNLSIILLDRNKKLDKSEHEVEISLYRMEYYWWYDYQYDRTDFITANYNNAILRQKISIKNGKAEFPFKFDDYGSYVLAVKDIKDGHTSSMNLYVSSYSDTYTETNKIKSSDILSLTSDKDSYNVGEEIKVSVPVYGGKALVSIENGFSVLDHFWINSENGNMNFSFIAKPEMAPNIYINVSYIQPFDKKINDRPVRMYGFLPVQIKDTQTELHPVINMPDELLAESKFSINVREKNGKPMTYTLAIVDEGLLNITNFKTPDPWNYFFSKQNLGVYTWDIYNYIMEYVMFKSSRLLNIGGDTEGVSPEDLVQAQRFKPLVIFLGPYTVSAGGVRTHTIQLPQYIGSVRTMVVAAGENSYGSVEKTTPVKKPLMILGAAPRTIKTRETFKLPVTVFAMKPEVKNVSVSVKTNGLLTINGTSSKSMTFTKEGEKYIDFELSANEKTGVAKIEITAVSGNNISKYNIEMDVNYPNTYQTKVIDKTTGNYELSFKYQPEFIKGTNETYLEIYNIPPLNLEKRIQYLTSYPHGCLEQKISGAFPQLYLSEFIELTNEQKEKIKDNIINTLNLLQRFQLPNGGFAYWPGSNNVSEWATNYTGHFIIEAEKAGYQIPANLKSQWIKYQSEKSSKWTNDGPASQLTQAYRLYTLALAGNPDRSAMNRLKESKISNEAAWRLALTYAITGKTNIAKDIISKLDTNVKKYFELGGTFGSDTRDKAMILETLTELGEKEKAFNMFIEVASVIGSENYASTQTTAYSLIAAAKFVKKYGKNEKIILEYTINGNKQTIKSNKPVYKTKLNLSEDVNTEFKFMPTENTYFVRLTNRGIPAAGEETVRNSNIAMQVYYTNLNGENIDVTNLQKGTDFIATVVLSNTSLNNILENVALSQIFPSGWEIINSRLFENNLGMDSYYDYMDIRDDRILTYFNMYKNRSYTYRVMLNASYEGKYYLPATYCETMYDNNNFASTKGRWINVVK